MSGNSTHKNENEKNKIVVQSLFSKLNDVKIEPSVFLEKRVMAHVEADLRENRRIQFWKYLSAVLSTLVVVLILQSYNDFKRDNHSVVMLGSPYVIQMLINSNKNIAISQVELVLPEGMYFVSSKGPLTAEKKLKLPFKPKLNNKNKLPFVVASNELGKKQVLIRFLDANSKLLKEEKVFLKFEG